MEKKIATEEIAMKEISITEIQPIRIGQTENAAAGTGCGP